LSSSADGTKLRCFLWLRYNNDVRQCNDESRSNYHRDPVLKIKSFVNVMFRNPHKVKQYKSKLNNKSKIN